MESIDAWGAANLDAYALRNWLGSHMDYSIYCATAYLVFVFACPPYVEKYFPATKTSVYILKKMWMVWNLLVSVFSFYGATRVVPSAISNLKNLSLHDSMCKFQPEQFYETNVGFAMALFAVSKLPEFVDTFFLVFTGKYKLPFLSWFHHVTTFLFAWFAYQEGTSIFIYCAAMNYVVHTIMYFYFALTEAGFKSLVKPFGAYITLLQITQMVGGLFVSSYVVVQKLKAIAAGEDAAKACAGTGFTNARTQLLIYIFNFYLFSQMFYYGYVKKRPATKRSE